MYENAKELSEEFISLLGAKSLTLLKQVHGKKLYVVAGDSDLQQSELFEREGDALITNVVGCAIGVLTADCLPIIFVDRVNQAIGIAHAGWRSAALGVGRVVVERMATVFGTVPSDLDVFFGPAARVCCYEVQEDFCEHIKEYADKVLSYSPEGKIFFDNTKFNQLQLCDSGVLCSHMYIDNHECTICDSSYHSYRRDKSDAGRQVSIVVLSGKG